MNCKSYVVPSHGLGTQRAQQHNSTLPQFVEAMGGRLSLVAAFFPLQLVSFFASEQVRGEAEKASPEFCEELKIWAQTRNINEDTYVFRVS